MRRLSNALLFAAWCWATPTPSVAGALPESSAARDLPGVTWLADDGWFVAPSSRGPPIRTARIGRTGWTVDRGLMPATRSKRRATLSWSEGVEEHVAAIGPGVEHSWRFPTRPGGSGPLRVRVESREGRALLHARGASFASARGETSYGAATWIDASGRALDVEMRVVDGGVELWIPGEVVDAAVYPVVLDPLVGPAVDLGRPVLTPGSGRRAVVASAPLQQLVVFESGGLWATRVGSDGALLEAAGAPIRIAGDRWTNNSAVACFDGTQYWVAFQAPMQQGLAVARIGTDGMVFDPGGRALGSPTWVSPEVACDGDGAMVVWAESGRVRGTRVWADGLVADPGGVDLVAGSEVAIAAGAAGFLLLVDDQFSVELGSVRLDRLGRPLDALPSRVDLSPHHFGALAAGFDGTDFVVAWVKRLDPDDALFVARIATSGALLDPGGVQVFRQADLFGAELPFALATTAGITWLSWSGTPPEGPMLSRFAGGALLDAVPWPVSVGAEVVEPPALSSDGARLAVVWGDGRYPDLAGVATHLARIEGDGRVLDPVGILVSGGGGNATREPAAAFGATGSLVTYTDFRESAGGSIYATRLADDWTPLDPDGIPIAPSAPGEAIGSAVACGATSCLVAWAERTGLDTVFAARVGADGSVVGGGTLQLSDGQSSAWKAVAASDGDGFFVGWVQATPGGGRELRGTVVDAQGLVAVPGGAVLATTLHRDERPSLVFDGSSYLIAWRIENAPANTPNLFFRRFATDGSPIEPAPVSIDPTATVGATVPGATVGPRGTLLAWRRFGTLRVRTVARDGTFVEPAYRTLADDLPLGCSFPIVHDGGEWLVVRSVGRAGVYEALWFDDDLQPLGAPALVLGDAASAVGEIALLTDGAGTSALVYQLAGPSSHSVLDRVVLRTLRRSAPDGARCVADHGCLSGFCVDGVCCNSACGDGQTEDCLACRIAEGAEIDGVCAVARAGALCRSARLECDVEERCDGVEETCPPDLVQAAGSACRPAGDACDPGESCDGLAADCPPDRQEPDGLPCDDEAACTLDDRCSGGRCEGRALSCPVPVCATTARCDPATGGCLIEVSPDGAGCADGDACTGPDVCLDGRCVGLDRRGLDCDDGDACTVRDTCTEAGCSGTPAVCGDGVCLIGSCDDATLGCVLSPAPEGAACDDSDACTEHDACSLGVCRGRPRICESANPCLEASCESAAGGCVERARPAGTPCDDGDLCTQEDACLVGGACAGRPTECGAEGSCSTGSCDPVDGRCVFQPLPDGAPCEDGDRCTVEETCSHGACEPGRAACTTDEPCAAAFCDRSTGACRLQTRHDGATCDDGDACTQHDACLAGACSGRALECPDDDPCLTPTGCDRLTGVCSTAALPDGAACPGGSCVSGRCQPPEVPEAPAEASSVEPPEAGGCGCSSAGALDPLIVLGGLALAATGRRRRSASSKGRESARQPT